MAPTASVLVCRGCCCGNDDPDQAERHVAILHGAVTSLPRGRLTLTNCLGPCSERDIVALRHRDNDALGRPLATTWLRSIDDEAIDVLDHWVRAGATGPVPSGLVPHAFDPAEYDVTPEDSITTSDRARNGVPTARSHGPQGG